MARMYMRYGTMNCGKSLQLLTVAHVYEQQGKKVLLFKPCKDTRSTNGFIESRTGMKHECIDISENFNIYTYVKILLKKHRQIDCMLIDESHWLTFNQVKELCGIADELDIPVIAYCLKNSYVEGELLEGVKYLLYYSDKIEELKNVCVFCNKKATMNLRIYNGEPVYDGNTTHVGDIKEGQDYYIPTCRKHYYKPII